MARKRARKSRPSGRVERRPGGARGTLVLAAVIGVTAALALMVAGPRLRTQPAPPPVSEDVPVAGTVKGSPDAPVTVVEFSDFQCRYCAEAALGLMKQVEANYITTGRVKLVFRHFPFMGQDSVNAALASECAAEQDRFWPYHELLFTSFRERGRAAYDVARLKEYATRLGLDRKSFDACLADQKYLPKLAEDFQAGLDLGVQGTPAFFVNGQKIDGLVPFEVMAEAIDKALAEVP